MGEHSCEVGAGVPLAGSSIVSEDYQDKLVHAIESNRFFDAVVEIE